MAIKIPVSAQFDAADLQQQIKMVNDQIRNLANQVGMANKQKWEPINLKSKDDLQGFIKQMDLLLKKQTEFAQKMKQSGQGGANPLFADFKKMAGGSLGEQIKLMESVLGWAGVEFSTPPAPKPPRTPPQHPAVTPPAPREPAWRGEMGRQGMGILNSGLNAAGPIGGTISNALNAGMSSGAGAGMMGLVGGLAALGVGKIVGAIADKISQAQDNAIGLDKLYRQVGGMVSYSRLGIGVGDAANRMGMTNAEAIGMASTYARAANLRPGMNLGTGMLVSGGLARQFGLDMSATAGTIGSMRGNNTVGSDQMLRRMGGIMGEAIGKSGAFARADDVMGSIAEFASAQAQESANTPDIARYAASLSSLAGQNLPGMDVRTSAALLGRANGALMNGGAAGAPGQMLMASLGNRYHLTPAQLRVWQENGMFGTLSGSLGAGSLYGTTTGRTGPGGSTPLFQAVSSTIGARYKPGSDEYYQALSRFFGINYSQAMTLSRMDTNGTMNGAANLMRRNNINADKMSPDTFGIMGQISSGAGLEGLGNQYLKRSDLSREERQELISALKGNDPEKLKDALARVASEHGGTATEGSQIRDNVARLNNTFEDYAKRALPALDMMRMALVKMAGGEGDEASLRQSYADREKKLGKHRIDMRFDAANRELQSQLNMETGNDAESNARRKALIDKQHANDKQRQIEIDAMNSRVDRVAGTGSTASEAALSASGEYIQSPAAAAAEGSVSPTAAGNWAGNNVGNVRDIHGNWRRFGSQAQGVAASAGQLLRYNTGAFRNGKVGRKTTLRQMISTYAPSNENATDAYVATIARNTGINPDAAVDARDPRILRAITGAVLVQENKKNRDLDPRIIDQGVSDALANGKNYGDMGPIDINTNHSVEVVLQHPDGGRQRVQTKFRQAHQWGGR